MKIRTTIIMLAAGVCVCTSANAGERKSRAIEAGRLWNNCVMGAAVRYAAQSEPAQSLATAAMGRCVNEASEFRVFLREATRQYGLPFTETADQESIDNAYDKVERQLFQAAVSAIIDTRAK